MRLSIYCWCSFYCF